MSSFANTLVSIIDDDPFVCAATSGLARSIGLDARVFVSTANFLDSDAPMRTHCLICDVGMPGINGLELLDQLESRGCYIPTLFVTAFASAALRAPGNANRTLILVEKPVDALVLEQWMWRALK